MDFSKFKTSDWLKVGGAAVMLIAYFLDWSNVEGSVFEITGSDLFFRGTVPWLLTLATGVIAFLLAGGIIKSSSVPWPPIFLIATALSTLLVLIYIINPTYSVADDIGRGIGAWLALIGAGAACAGSYIGFTESGGSIAKIGDSFKTTGSGPSSSMAPPPPPPGSTPPPPPPPPG
jgi:hypothetical protein